MNLCLDIGNTRTKVGLFAGGELRHTETFARFGPEEWARLPYNRSIKNCIFSATGHTDPERIAWLSTQAQLITFDHHTLLPIKNSYRTPETLGRDRLAAVVGGSVLFPGATIFVVDAGTCVTYDLLDSKGTYRGGNIAPGLRMRAEAMQHFTAKLPFAQPAITKENPWLGNSTQTALALGAARGLLLEIEGYLAYLEEEFQQVRCILTGGDTSFLASHLKSKIFARPNLVLHGLNKILEYNVEKRS